MADQKQNRSNVVSRREHEAQIAELQARLAELQGAEAKVDVLQGQVEAHKSEAQVLRAENRKSAEALEVERSRVRDLERANKPDIPYPKALYLPTSGETHLVAVHTVNNEDDEAAAKSQGACELPHEAALSFRRSPPPPDSDQDIMPHTPHGSLAGFAV